MKGLSSILQFFGDKYGDIVRVVQIGGTAGALDGYSMELCGGTHVRDTGQIGLFRISSEAAVAAGIRRIEAIAGYEAWLSARHDSERLQALATRIGSPVTELEKKLETTLLQIKNLEKELQVFRQREATALAKNLLNKAVLGSTPSIVEEVSGIDVDTLQATADVLRGSFEGVILLAAITGDAVALVAAVGKSHQGLIPAGKLISTVAPLVGGKGGGRPDSARGGGRDSSGLDSALDKARGLIASGKI